MKSCPFSGDIPLGLYELPRRSGEAHLYRLNHPLAEAVIAQGKARNLPVQEICFNYGDHDGKISSIEPLVGKSGWLTLSNFAVESLDQAEDHMIFAGVTDDNTPLDEEAMPRLFTLPGVVRGPCAGVVPNTLATATQIRQTAIQRTISERNARFFEAEAEKLDGWAEDLKLGLEREIKEIDREIRETRRSAAMAITLELKLAGQKQIKALELRRSEKRRSLFQAQDDVDRQREELIQSTEKKLFQKVNTVSLFAIRWCLT